MYRKLSWTTKDLRLKNLKKRGAVVLIFFLLLLLWTFPIRPNPYGPLFYISSPDPFAPGKAAFYSILHKQLEDTTFPDNIRSVLLDPDRKYPLYDHLMNYYFYAARLRDTRPIEWMADDPDFSRRILALSSKMAFELIDDINIIRNRDPDASILSLLQSTGIYTARMKPIYRQYRKSFFRPLPWKTKTQRILDDLDIRRIHRTSKGKTIKLAIVDSGMDPTYKELKPQLYKHRDFLTGTNPLRDSNRFPYDWGGHGTAIASIIYQTAPLVELMIVKFYDSTSMASVSPSRWTAYLMAAGIIWAVENGADIINLSSALSLDIPIIRAAVKYSWDRNVILITSIGNDFGENDKLIYYPAAYPWSIAVSGVEKTGENWKVWKHSGQGDYIDVAAPADNIFAAAPSYLDRPGMLVQINGNSFAAAVVSGAAAVLLSSLDLTALEKLRTRPGTMTEFVRNILRSTAADISQGYRSPNTKVGYGLIDIVKAVKLAGKLSDPGHKPDQ